MVPVLVPVLVPMMIQGFYPRLWYQTKVKILSFDFYICFHHLFTNIGPSTRLSIGPSIWFYVWILYLNVKYKILYLVPIFNFLVWFIVGERVENFSAKLPAQNYQQKNNTKSNTENCARTPNYYTTTVKQGKFPSLCRIRLYLPFADCNLVLTQQ